MNILHYLITLLAFVVIDGVWLGVIAKNFYADQLGSLMTKNVNWIAAIGFYLLFIFGLLVFVITPALKDNSLLHAVLYGALFGLITYATYDLTNLATLKNWPLTMTMVDLVWGAVLSSSVSAIAFVVIHKLGL